ncbi:MAG: M20/M25/M40 family metallo-hydrolase [Deltaproteobacteria bacterium]|nr:M20/M25/M40 family metallo-hydrolase [Deltaproteobacteria bacterium]
MKKYYSYTPLLIVLMLLVSFGCGTDNSHDLPSQAYEHIKHISEDIGSRPSGSLNAFKTRLYIAAGLVACGYTIEIQPFSYTASTGQKTSANIIAEKKGPLSETIIIGAHYDSVATSQGAADNASGIGVLLALAAALKDIETACTVRFIAFGAEEDGLNGSTAYVNSLSDDELADIFGMINLDTTISGDIMYINSGLDGDTALRDMLLETALQLNITFEMSPGLHQLYPAGTTGNWSDHAPFNKLGIAVAHIESTNWNIGDYDGFTQTEAYGALWHTANDNLSFIENNFPGRIDAQLSDTCNLLATFLTSSENITGRLSASHTISNASIDFTNRRGTDSF